MQVSISSNPFRMKANESHQARRIMKSFWGQDSLNGFTRSPFEFSVCKRVKDKWYSSVIDECRDGALSDSSYNFLHGYPTLTCGSAIQREEPSCGCDSVIEDALQSLRDEWWSERSAPQKQVESTKANAPMFDFGELSGAEEEIDPRHLEVNE